MRNAEHFAYFVRKTGKKWPKSYFFKFRICESFLGERRPPRGWRYGDYWALLRAIWGRAKIT